MAFEYTVEPTKDTCPHCNGALLRLTTGCSMNDCSAHPEFLICDLCTTVIRVRRGRINEQVHVTKEARP